MSSVQKKQNKPVNKKEEPKADGVETSQQLQFHFESVVLIVIAVGLSQLGFFYTTIFAYGLMTVAFTEMIKLQSREDKE